jgi:hypothetical protein
MAEEAKRIREDSVTVIGVPDSKASPAVPGEDAPAREEGGAGIRVGVKEDVADIRRRIKGFVSRALRVGFNTPVSAIAEDVVKKTGLVDEKWVHYTTVQVNNNISREFFMRVPKSERVVFIPHCLRDAKNCKADVDEDGYHCKKCGRCPIGQITAGCEARGMKWYMCGGGSQVINIIQRKKPKAIIGIACFNEIQMALEKLNKSNAPIQAVMLRRSGCVNTDVDVEEVWEVLDA